MVFGSRLPAAVAPENFPVSNTGRESSLCYVVHTLLITVETASLYYFVHYNPYEIT